LSEHKLEKEYEELLTLAKDYDACFVEKSTGWGRSEVDEEKLQTYWKCRESLESGTATWITDVRKAINSIPASARKSTKEQRTDPETGDTFSFVKYDNRDFESIMGYLEEIAKAVEGDRGVLEALRTAAPVYLILRDMRGSVLSLTRSLELFHPEIMITIDQQVDLIFKLRDKGMSDVALLVEEIDQLEDNAKKCLNARTALEKTIEYYCKSKSVDVKQGFYTNLDNAINAGLTEKSKRNAIAGHYSFMSKLIHGELETNPRNTQFAVTGALNILHSLVQ
jgi:hypothetical protein